MKYLSAAALAVCLVGTGHAQIKVNVNGDPVIFTGAGPQKIGGRVLVPLRGVMEKIGAFVGWDSSTRTVTAQKGNIDLQMRLGESTAVVNGRTVTLDVPAQSINGVTMVPLRFMGETLGAEIKWDGATETISILMGGNTNTGGGGDTGNVTVSISSFSHDAQGWVGKGKPVSFTLVGTPGGKAAVSVSGVEGTIPMTESAAGRYTAQWTPAANVSLQGTSVIANLRVGNSEKAIQAGTTLSVDSQAPAVKNVTPEQGASVAVSRPDVSGVFQDDGSGVDLATVVLKVNGVDVTKKATINNSFFLYEPDANLPNGLANIDISFKDRAGNATSFQGSFMVASPNNAGVKSFLHTARYYAQAGKTIGFKVETAPGAKVTINAGTIIKALALKESTPGVFQGSYLVKDADKFNNTPVVATITLANGTNFTVESPNKIPKTLEAGAAFGPATITSHKDGAKAADPLVISGKALPRSKVQIRVTYATTVLGALRVTGVVSDQTVDVDANGVWSSQGISLSSAVQGQNTEYTVSAIAIAPDGKKAEATTIKLK